MPNSPYVMDVGIADFGQKVMNASRQVPVLVDFWAPWCGPCKTLGPMLEKLAEEYKGRFLLAKVNSDENQELAGHFGVRSIPTVKVVFQGQLVDEFTGALPESELRRFIDGLLPSAADPLYAEAHEAMAAGEPDRAMQLLSQVLAADPAHEGARLDLAELLLDGGHPDDARQALAGLEGLAVQDQPRLDALLARLEVEGTAPPAGEEETALAARLAADPADLAARLELAGLQAARRDYEPAMENLLEIVRRDRSFQEDAGRTTLLSLFNLLGSGHELVRKYRRQLATTLNV